MSALSGIRVLDFGRVLSAPYGTMALADLGADVVKVEHPDKGDDTRSFGPPFVRDVSTYFLSINRGKRSIVLDLKNKKDLQVAKELAEQADVLVENFRPGVMERIGLGATALMVENPKLIYCSLTGYGRDVPDKPGYDLMMQGLSGIPSITGPVDGESYKCGASIADLVAGMNLVQGVLAALFRRERTGKGGLVDVSMMDGVLSLLTYHASSYLNGDVEPQRRGNGHASIHPFQPYQCADGALTLCVGNDKLFSLLSEAMGHTEWAVDPRFATNPERVRNREALDARLEPLFKSKGKLAWKKILNKFGVPCDIVATIPEALRMATLLSHDHPDGQSSVQSLRLPFALDDEPRGSSLRSPQLGEHQEEVLCEWLGIERLSPSES